MSQDGLKLEPKMSKCPTWTSARGPLSAVWLSLLRIGWDMRAAHPVCDDQGQVFSMLQLAPEDIRQLLYLVSNDGRWDASLPIYPSIKDNHCGRGL